MYKNLSNEEKRDILSRMASGELVIKRVTGKDNTEIEETASFTERRAAIAELNKMDETAGVNTNEGEMLKPLVPGDDL